MTGTLCFVVGPSGIGKDTLLKGARERLASDPNFVFARRVITRPADVGDEGHEAVTPGEFAARRGQGGFLIAWTAHGLDYGVAASLRDDLAAGRTVIVNGSRAAVADLLSQASNVIVIEVTAPRSVIEQRLKARGREGADEIKSRVERVTPPYPPGTKVVTVSNDSDVETGVERLVAAFRTAPRRPHSRDARALLEAKIAGDELDEDQYRTVLNAVVREGYDRADVERFLVAAANALTLEEIVAIARVRAEFAPAVSWPEPIVVDKHSLGGVPGSRITLVVVPIVAAHGLAMPKASSRAITSAAGTADAMETVARVDLSLEDVRAVIDKARGSIVWNGRLNHSALDDVMNAITRPRGLDSARWSVASILSKKISAGVTNLIVDLPFGRFTKLKTARDANDMANLFVAVGARLGLKIEAKVSAGAAPIGRGIGPALEVRDVLAVLDNSPSAPADLRAKALDFAASILAWSKEIGTQEAGYRRASDLLESGAARLAFDRIVDAQGRRTPAIVPGRFIARIKAQNSGLVSEIDGWTIAGIARAAGAPLHAGAGLDLHARAGDALRAGDVLYDIRADDEQRLAAAVKEASLRSGFDIR